MNRTNNDCWVSHQDAVGGKDAEDAEEGEYAVACKDAELPDLSTLD